MKTEILVIFSLAVVLAVITFLLVFFGGFEKTAVADLCSNSSDCGGMAHDDCLGQWDCATGLCIWLCENKTGNKSNVTAECQDDGDCIATGCSSQICSSEPVISTCEWKDEYSCVNYSRCGCFNGKCAWERNRKYLDCKESFS